jgi:hypothetical protein
MLINTLLAPFGQVLRKLCLYKPWQSREPLPGHCCSKALSQESAPLELAYLLPHILKWIVFRILESSRHELRLAHGLTLMNHSLRGWEAFPTPGALTHIRITWAFSPLAPQVRGVTSGSPLCPWYFKHRFWRGVRHPRIKAWWASSKCTSEEGLKHLQLWLAFWHFWYWQWGGFNWCFFGVIIFFGFFFKLCLLLALPFHFVGKNYDRWRICANVQLQFCEIHSQQMASSVRQQRWRSICDHCGWLYSSFSKLLRTISL